MNGLQGIELKLLVDSVRTYFEVVTGHAPQITSAFLGAGDIEGHDFNGIVSFSGSYIGHVLVSMPRQQLRELLLLQGETDLCDHNLLDAVGEIANTLGGNARKSMGSELRISVPMTMQGASGMRARVRKHPYVITLRWGHQSSLVCVDIEKRL